MNIGRVKLENNVILSPMAGITDLAFRIICKEMGAGLVVSEMVSSKGIYYQDKKTEELLRIDPGERPVSVQIFGSDPKIMSHIVEHKLNKREDIDIIDINMGCPAPKIVKNGDGSALMREPKLAEEICRQVVAASHKPVSLKIRTGWDQDSINCLEIAQRAQDVGIDAVTIHGRTRDMFYSGQADWDHIRRVKENLSIPVIGNGDIFTPQDALDMIEYTKCDGVALGRGVQGNPWIFKRILDKIEGRPDWEPSLEEITKMAIFHLHLVSSIKGPQVGVKEMRKHLAHYFKGQPNSAAFKDQVNKLNSLEEVTDKLWAYYEENK